MDQNIVNYTFFFHSVKAKSKGKYVAFAFKSKKKIGSALPLERAKKKRNRLIAQNYFAFLDVPIIVPIVGESRFKFDI